MIHVVKRVVKTLVPVVLLELWYKHMNDRTSRQLALSTPQKAFSAIYRKRLWGEGGATDFCSGTGSHNPGIVAPYVSSIRQFLGEFPDKPNVVDLGCGDFNVGQQIRNYCNQYVACDVVPDLILRNKIKFSELNVDFRCLDISRDLLPQGDVVFIRQVLQHLTNDHIMQVVNKLEGYKFLVLTEHLPLNPVFVANKDKVLGASIRSDGGGESGVVLTSYPFNLHAKSQRIICEVSAPVGPPGLIQTIVYELN